MKKSLILIILLLIPNFSVQGNENCIYSNILYVGGSGPGNYSTIQSAIDNATDGDIIFIYNGIYYETPWVNKSLSVIGEDSETTIIDGKQSKNDIFSVNASFFNINGITIQNNTYPNYGIFLKNINIPSLVKDCILFTPGGIRVYKSSNLRIDSCLFQKGIDGIFYLNTTNCTISNCIINMDEYGINLISNSNNNSIIDCQISRYNTSSFISYGFFTSSNNNKIIHCNISYCSDGIGFSGNNNSICNCNIDNNNRRGIVAIKGDFNLISHCQITNNGNEDSQYGIEIYDSHDNSVENCTISNNGGGGIYISFLGKNNTVTKSIIEKNGYSNIDGAGISSYSYNKIFLNNIIGNNMQAADYHSNSEWDNGKYGNFWSDYTGPDWNRDEIGDKPYRIFNNSQDNFPLLCPYNTDGPSVLIERPAHFKGNFLYLRNLRILKLPNTILIGNIEVTARAINYDNSERIIKMEFYIDGVLRHVDFLRPYNWYWRLSSPLNHLHTLSVIAYDSKGRTGQDSCQIYKLL